MRRKVTIYNAYDLLAFSKFYSHTAVEVSLPADALTSDIDTVKRWVPARALGPSWHQWRALWLVWTGRADVLHWPGQER
jgi:hypothetical protein